MVKKIYEKDIQREICDWLHGHNYFFWRQNTIPVFDKGHFRAMPKYTPNGLPDIICLRYGKFIGFEVKLPNRNKGSRAQPYILSPHQKEMGEKIITHGGAYHVVTSLQEVVDIMNIVEVDYPELQSVK